MTERPTAASQIWDAIDQLVRPLVVGTEEEVADGADALRRVRAVLRPAPRVSIERGRQIHAVIGKTLLRQGVPVAAGGGTMVGLAVGLILAEADPERAALALASLRAMRDASSEDIGDYLERVAAAVLDADWPSEIAARLLS